MPRVSVDYPFGGAILLVSVDMEVFKKWLR